MTKYRSNTKAKHTGETQQSKVVNFALRIWLGNDFKQKGN